MKIFKIVISLILILWLGLEVFNFYEYRKQEERNIMAPLGPVIYRPVIYSLGLAAYNSIFNISVKPGPVYKPVIYLYPTKNQEVTVVLDYKGKIIADYPAYDFDKKGWEVTANPSGKIIGADGKEYSYLFWEGIPAIKTQYDLSTGFVVRGEDAREFLQATLSKMGLMPQEYNEFIVYWYPKLAANRYNLIHFAETEYTDTAPLVVMPKPDSILRVFMVFKPLDKVINVGTQEIKSFNRTGFSLVEWGGTELEK